MNLYDVRDEKKQVYFLPLYNSFDRKIVFEKTAVVINFYYEETLNYYLEYVANIPPKIDVYIITSNDKIISSVNKLENGIITIKKNNRGRDLSALLVAFKPYVGKYDYICFIHDKKAHEYYQRDDVKFWVENLWGNMLGSKSYIYNVLNVFKSDESIGMLVPPEPIGDFLNQWYGDTWGNNYCNCKKLAMKLGLNVEISDDKELFTLGTVFWARTKVLGKLYSYEWKYEDFADEPMPVDGTISHAIERILGFVVQDAGYYVGTVMSDRYASRLYLRVQKYMRDMFFYMRDHEFINNMYQISNMEERENKIRCFCEKQKEIYLFGAGDYGKKLYKFMQKRNLTVKGYIVSDRRENPEIINGIPVFELREMKNREIGVIIAVSYEYRDEVETVLQEMGIKNYIYGY